MREVFPSHRSVLFSDEEAVRTRSGLESHEAVRRADVGQGRILGKGFAVGFDLRNVGCRNAERGRRIGRYLDRPRQTAAGPFPMAADRAVHRLIGRIDPLEPLREVGLHQNVFEAQSRRVGLDTGQVFPVPCDQVAQLHQVIARVHRRIGRIAVP